MSRGLGTFTLFNLNLIGIEALKLSAIVILAGLLHQNFSATAIAIFALDVLWSILIVWRVRTIHDCRWSPSLGAFRRLQSYSSRAAVVKVTSALHRNVDRLMIVGLLIGGANRLTEYHIAIVWLLPVTMLSGLLSPVFLPRLSHDSGDNAVRLTTILIRTLWYFGSLSLIALCIVGFWLIPILFGEENRTAIQPMFLLAPGILSLLLTSCVTTYLASRRDFRFWIRMGTVAFLANVGLNWLLIPLYGIRGAAMATTLTYSLECIGLIAYFKHKTRVPFRDLFLLRAEDLSPIWKTLHRRGV